MTFDPTQVPTNPNARVIPLVPGMTVRDRYNGHVSTIVSVSGDHAYLAKGHPDDKAMGRVLLRNLTLIA